MRETLTTGSEMLKYGQNAEEEIREHGKEELRGGGGTLMRATWPSRFLLDSPCLQIVFFHRA
jgi:hypothetical protein